MMNRKIVYLLILSLGLLFNKVALADDDEQYSDQATEQTADQNTGGCPYGAHECESQVDQSGSETRVHPSYGLAQNNNYNLDYSYNVSSDTEYGGPRSGEGTFVFDPKHLHFKAYNPNGELVAEGKAIGGSNYCRDLGHSCHTPTGHFSVYHMGPAECHSSIFPLGRGGAYMPYCMFFHGGFAVHGATELPDYNASHGCIRIHPSAARWLYYNFVRPGTRVIVLPY